MVDEEFYDELMDILIMSDAGVAASQEIMDKLRQQIKKRNVKSASKAREMLKDIIEAEMDFYPARLGRPWSCWWRASTVWGKTTTIGKLALRFQAIGFAGVIGRRRYLPCCGGRPTGCLGRPGQGSSHPPRGRRRSRCRSL